MDDDRIRRRAYEIWEREGCPPGRRDAHWEQARRELEAEAEANAPTDLDAVAARPAQSGPVLPARKATVRGRAKAPGSGGESGGAA